jgi:hypothetical protein
MIESMELNTEFFDNFLKKIESLFEDKNMSIIECKNKEDGETFYALAATKVNPVTQLLEFTPICFFWNKNPMLSMEVTERPLCASQRSLSEWADEAANAEIVDIRVLN